VEKTPVAFLCSKTERRINMTNKNQIKSTNYEKASKLLSKLVDADSDAAEQINSMIRQQGIARFFKNLNKQELSPEVLEKLQAVKLVLFGLGMAGEGNLRGGEINNA
jgi:hypothetical protein